MKYFNLNLQYKILKKNINHNLKKVLDDGRFILGPEVFKLEDQLCEFSNSKYSITCSSGTDAILMSLMALNIKKNDEIITSSFTWMSNVEMIKLLGAKIVYADILPKTFNIDPKDVEKKITKKTKAILAISLFGQTADLVQLKKIAKKNNIYLIEDAAQSFGATHYKRKSCSIADISTTSFFPTKPLGGYGDGGSCFTNNKYLAEKLKMIRNHGQKQKGENLCLGLNARLDTLQAAILLEKLSIFKQEFKQRQLLAENYKRLFSTEKNVITPFVESFNQSVYAQYTLYVKRRNNLSAHLNKKKIPFMIFYAKPTYKQKAYKDRNLKLKNTEYACKNVISIPFYPGMKINDQYEIVNAIKNFYRSTK